MGYMIRLVDSIALSPLLHFLCYEMRSLMSALQNATMVVKAFCKSTDGGCWKTHCRQERQIHIWNMCLLQWGWIFAPSIIEEAQCSQLAGWFPQEWCHIGARYCLCCWQISKALSSVRAALDREAAKTSIPSEVITGFSRKGRLVSWGTGRQATSTGKGGSEWLGSPKL